MNPYRIFGCIEPRKDVEKAFDAGASLTEGISGQLEIETKYENNCPPEDIHPRTTDTMPKTKVNGDYDGY